MKIKRYKDINEAITDLMIPKPDDEIKRLVKNLSPMKKIQRGVQYNAAWLVEMGFEEAHKESIDLDLSNLRIQLEYAVSHGCAETVEQLLKYEHSNIYYKPFFDAARAKNMDMINFFIEDGLNLDIKQCKDDLLRLIRFEGHDDIVKLILKVKPEWKQELKSAMEIHLKEADKIKKFI